MTITRFTPEQQEAWRRYLEYRECRTLPVKQNPVVAYGGAPGSYSEDAAIRYFGESAPRVACREFEDIFKSVLAGGADYGVIPIENSTTGSVNDLYDLLLAYDCMIVGETQVTVSHCLMGVAGADLSTIREVYSHPQSLAQSAAYLQEHSWKLVPFTNNALAAGFVAESGNTAFAAVASERAAALNGLTVLARGLNSMSTNATRFLVIADHLEQGEERTKLSVSFAVTHEHGALLRVLSVFDSYALNLCRIESRPSLENRWEYNFFVDFEGSLTDAHLDDAVHDVIASTKDFRFLGSYASAIH